MTKEILLHQLTDWGAALRKNNKIQSEAFSVAEKNNPWFTEREIFRMLNSILTEYLDSSKLARWLSCYEPNWNNAKNIAIICAGNIPLVSFHDILCCIASGHHLQIKLSEKDNKLPLWILQTLFDLFPEYKEKIKIVDQIKDFEAVIATGGVISNNLFNFYFKKYPHILRSHRNSIAILNGLESDNELSTLGIDIFSYFGLGCRNVSKIYVPESYKFDNLIQILDEKYSYVKDHSKYVNNYEYNLSLYLLNKVHFYQGNSLLLMESTQINSKIASLHFEYYKSEHQLVEMINPILPKVQCILSSKKIDGLNSHAFSTSQYPALTDYADNLDTMQFLTSEIYFNGEN